MFILFILLELMESSESDWLKRRRRIKKEEDTIECGCGKRYKLKTSFDTHVKQSHNGVVSAWLSRLPNPSGNCKR
jgi:hypothetical protein